MKKQMLTFILTSLIFSMAAGQENKEWKGKQCAVVLTYDDALNVHLDKVIPQLDSAGFRGTFYVTGNSSVIDKRLNEWRKAAKEGHELGNHTLNHPCDGSAPGRSWVGPETDLSKYTLSRAVMEIRATNTLLKAIDGLSERTFAYPCGDSKVAGESYYPLLQNEFVAARGVTSAMQHVLEIDLSNIQCFGMNGQEGDEMINLVKKAMESHTLIVFLFHGVGGEHSINVSAEAHSQLIHFLKAHKKEIWVAPMVEVAQYIKKEQQQKKR